MINKKERIDLGNGFICEGGIVKETVNENSGNNKEWLTHDECWQWVADSLRKIYKTDENKL